MTVGWALCWEIWARQRWLAGGVAAYLILFIVLGRTLLERVHHDVTVLLVFPLLFAMEAVIAGVCHGLEGKLEVAGSMLPARLFVLPVSARALVGWSMLGGAVPLGLLWPLCVLLLMWPRGAPVPLLWPGLLMFNVAAWLQTLCWVPFGLPYVRVGVVGLGVPGLIFGTLFLGVEVRVPEPILVLLLSALGLAAFGLAVAGVKWARHGVGFGEGSSAATTRASLQAVARPFASPVQALVWREWRLYRWGFGWVYGIVFVFGLLFLHGVGLALEDKHKVEAIQMTAAVQAVGPGWLTLAQLLWAPFLFAATFCAELGKISPGARELTSFTLVRPVSTPTLVKVKLLNCAWVVLLGWTVFLVMASIWALKSGHWVEMVNRLLEWQGSWWAAGLVLAGGAATLLTITWGQLAAGLWIGLTGRRWIEWLAVAVAMTSLIGGGIAFILIGTKAPDRFLDILLKSILPALLIGAIVLKSVLALVVYRENLRRGFLSSGGVLLALGTWVTAAAGLFAGLAWLIPAEMLSRGYLAAGVVLVLPIARIGLAPLALAWNRHR